MLSKNSSGIPKYQKDFVVSKEVRYSLEEILLNILINEYQQPFNTNPKRTILEIKRFAIKGSSVSGLANRVLNYYSSVSEFSIPGYGTLKGVA